MNGGTAGAAGLVILVGACSSSRETAGTRTGDVQFTVHVELASQVKSSAPTTVGIVTWSTTAPGITSAEIDFGLDTTYGMVAPVELKRTDYRTVLLGMKPEKTYHFRIVASDGITTHASEDHLLATGAKNTASPIASFSVSDAAKLARGFFVASFWRGTNAEMPFIFDMDGDVVWWYEPAPGESTDGVAQAKMSADGQSVWLVNEILSGAPLRRVSIDGLTTQTYENTSASHAIAAVGGDTMVYLDYTAGKGACNPVFEIDSTGVTKLLWTPTNPPLVLGTFPSCHANALRYSLKEDQITYSDLLQDVVVLDRAGNVKWTLAGRVTGGNSDWGGRQHGHQLTDDSMILFANDGAGTDQAQAVEYGLDGSLKRRFASNGSASNFGDVQRLANGNTVITYKTSLQEVDASDALVLEVKGSSQFGYVEFRESLYGLPLDIQQ
jgi:hypothetical protein